MHEVFLKGKPRGARTRRRQRFGRDVRLSGAMVEIDERTGRALRIVRIHERLDE